MIVHKAADLLKSLFFQDSVGDPKVPVTILQNMGRCGSTMVCKVLAQIPGLRVMGEPSSFLMLQYHFQKGSFGLNAYSKLILSVIRIEVTINQKLKWQLTN